MSDDFCGIIEIIAREIFGGNRHKIINKWLKLVKEEDILSEGIEMTIAKINFRKLVEDFIKFLSVGDLDSYYRSNEEIACSIAHNDISFEKFLNLFHLFEDSYLPLIEELSNENFRRYITCLDKLHHSTIAIITRKYFDIRDNVIFALTKLIELRDFETSDHLDRTRKYSVLLARELGGDSVFINIMDKASALHDIGKVAVNDNVLLKPGKLTEQEFEEVKKHTIIGAKAIDDIIKNQKVEGGYLYTARDIALYHHEKFDGSGYPKGLKGKQIPLCARILALVDAYDTIVSKRPYKTACTHEEAVRRIISDSGKHFDPSIVDAFLRVSEEFRISA
jgi:response regulator RpfG family c-di-GMP phosphodiesterase